jgi:hypothetical protein
MHNQSEGPGPAQAAPQADDQAPLAEGHGPVLSLPGDPCDPLTTEELAQIAQHVREEGPVEATIRGQRVLIVGDFHHPRLAMAHLAVLAEAGALLVRPDDHVVALEKVRLDEQVLRLKGPEPMIVSDFDGDEKRKGKGKRRRDWESPFGNPGGKHKGNQAHRNIKQMLPRRGGR